MAWYALYKWFIPFRLKPYTNWVSWYKSYLHEQWFESLSDEDKQKVLEFRKRKEEENKRKTEEFWEHTNMMFNMLNHMTHGRVSDYMDIICRMNKMF